MDKRVQIALLGLFCLAVIIWAYRMIVAIAAATPVIVAILALAVVEVVVAAMVAIFHLFRLLFGRPQKKKKPFQRR
jgi:uncharacterized membrane protein YcjF (UPF0283 family)